MVALLDASLSAGALGFSSSLGDAHTDGDGAPVPSRAAGRDEFLALAGALRDHPGTMLEFIPAVGEISAERMELMADMSLAANRPLNWNLLGSLSPVEIYEQQLQASRSRGGARCPSGRAHPARPHAHAREPALGVVAGLERGRAPDRRRSACGRP